MPRYTIDVIEVRHVLVRYVVEASHVRGVADLWQRGETVGEEDIELRDVIDRFGETEPRRIRSKDCEKCGAALVDPGFPAKKPEHCSKCRGATTNTTED